MTFGQHDLTTFIICNLFSFHRTDQWAAYEGLAEMGYQHFTVNHSREFVSAENRWV